MICDICSTDLPEGALFCGECGSSVTSRLAGAASHKTQSPGARSQSSDTDVLPQFLNDGIPVAPLEVDGSPDHVASPLFADPLLEPPLPTTPILAAMLSAQNEALAEAALSVESTPEVPRYLFTLSTGESLEVSANGLLGRMPQPAAGETFAHLIIVTDTTRSVSKTHLEFGFEGEQLWILDRNSGNGSIIREVGKIPRRAEPWRQYAVGRGTRVDLGDARLFIS